MTCALKEVCFKSHEMKRITLMEEVLTEGIILARHEGGKRYAEETEVKASSALSRKKSVSEMTHG